MKKPIFTITALAFGTISLILSIGWWMNRTVSGDWFEETGFLLNLPIIITAISAAIYALLRHESGSKLSIVAIITSLPGSLLWARYLMAITGFTFYGDT